MIEEVWQSPRPWNSAAEYREEDGVLQPYCHIDGELKRVTWAPLPGSQAAFLACSELIVLLQGARATGKTLTLLMDMLQFVGIGLGAEYKAVFFRRFFPELDEAEAMSKIWFPRIHPGATYNQTFHTWSFPAGETFKFRQMPDADTFQNYQGQAFSWIALDEAAAWRTAECFKLLLSLLSRSTDPRAPNHMRLATNTYGKGRDWLMKTFHLSPAPQPMFGPLITGDDLPPRRVITARLEENLPLMYVQPQYIENLRASTSHNAALQLSWTEALWAAPPGNFFGDVGWDHVIVPAFEPPTPGRIRIAFDHGRTAPCGTVFVWPSKGETVDFPDGTRKATRPGDLFVVDEDYTASKPNVGLKLSPSEIARRLRRIVERHQWNPKILSASGNVADTSIFSPGMNDNRASVAQDMERAGINFEAADKARVLGAGEVLKMLMAAKPPEDGPREEPALFICANCENLLRTLPNLQRDEGEPDDVDQDGQEDHLYDALRYFLRREKTPPLSTHRRWRM